MNVLVLNCGSSSLKFQIIETDLDGMEKNADRQKARGLVERIGGSSQMTLTAIGQPAVQRLFPLADHRLALDEIIQWLGAADTRIPGLASLADIHAVGHRVVHGGERFTHSTLIDLEVIRGIEAGGGLAPLHTPPNLKGIIAARECFGPAIPQVAVFDTAFHSTMPPAAYLYAIPYELYERHKIRRYGFHGTSHRFVAQRYRELTGKTRENTHIITIHLGNGCSACAIKHGASLDTSMGLTPLEGLVMGTRSGDVDPAIFEFLATREGRSTGEITALLNQQSGLLGLSGLTNDMRDLLQAEQRGDERARLAVDIFCRRVRKYIGAYLAEMSGADALIFTGGIGENCPAVRQRICAGLEWLGIEMDGAANAPLLGGREGAMGKPGSRVGMFVIPTNEELLIARDTVRCIHDGRRAGK